MWRPIGRRSGGYTLERLRALRALSSPEPMRPRFRARGILLALAVFAAAVLWHPASAHLRAASLLSRFTRSSGSPGDTSSDPIGDLGRHAIAVTDVDLPGTRGRIYAPVDVRYVAGLPGLVVVHGVHWKGIDEPRLQASRA